MSRLPVGPMKFRPLQDRVLVKRSEATTKSAGGIHIPGNAQDKPVEGEVLATGPGKFVDGHLRPMGVKIGEVVVFGKYKGADIEIEGEPYTILEENDILGVK